MCLQKLVPYEIKKTKALLFAASVFLLHVLALAYSDAGALAGASLEAPLFAEAVDSLLAVLSLVFLSLLLLSPVLLSLVPAPPPSSVELEDLRLSVMYQPLPLKITPTGWKMRWIGPLPQFTHSVSGSAVIGCIFSKRLAQFLHSYS